MSINNLSKNKQWTESKYKLVELVADIPGNEEAFFKYLYLYLVGGMAKEMFPMSIGHEDAIKGYVEVERKIEEEKAKEEACKVVSEEEQRMNEYVSSILNGVITIRKAEREDCLRYIQIILDDIVKESRC